MKKKGLANIYWFVMAIAVVFIVGVAWMSTSYKPIKYTSETGRQQAVVFNGYITAEQVRNYAEESARLAAFNALAAKGVPFDKVDCFDFATPDDEDHFAEVLFSEFINAYMSEYPLENQYSDIFPPLYGNFKWVNAPWTGDDLDSISRLEPSAGNRQLIIQASPNGDIQVWNSRYYFIYSAEGAFMITVNCTEYEDYINIITAGTII